MGLQSWIWLRNFHFQDCSKIAFTPILLGVQEKVNPGRGDINVEREGINKFISALLVCLLFLLFSPLVVSNSAALWTATPQASPVLYYLPEFAQAHVHRVSDAIQPSHPLFPPSPPLLNLSQHQVFSNESALHIRWPKYWSFSFSISPSNGYSGLVSFRTHWFDLLEVQGTLKSLLQHHGLKASLLLLSAFFMVQLSHSCLTTGRTIVWLYGPLSEKWCLCFLIFCLGWSKLSFQGVSVFLSHGCSHHLQWF